MPKVVSYAFFHYQTFRIFHFFTEYYSTKNHLFTHNIECFPENKRIFGG